MITITVSGAADISLYHIAARQYGDATQWYRIADLNGLSSPMLANGITTLLIPDADTNSSDGVPAQ